jgi:rubrerythrin
MGLLGADQLLRCAIRIEENGEEFYREWAGKTKDEEQKKLFNFFADEERKHKKTFEEMLKEIGDFQPESHLVANEAYNNYLKTFVEEMLFNEKFHQKEMKLVIDVISALEYAMKLELDSILFYTDVKAYLPKSQLAVVEKIIEEERKHFSDLGEFKEMLGG